MFCVLKTFKISSSAASVNCQELKGKAVKTSRETEAVKSAESFRGSWGRGGFAAAGGRAGTCQMASVWQNPGASERQTGNRRVLNRVQLYFYSAHVAEFTRWRFLNLLPVNIKCAGQECGSTEMVCKTHFRAGVERMEAFKGIEAASQMPLIKKTSVK